MTPENRDNQELVVDCVEAGLIAATHQFPARQIIYERVGDDGPLVVSVDGRKFQVDVTREH